MNKKKTLWLFLIYAIGCLTPYFIPALNQVEPWICGISLYGLFYLYLDGVLLWPAELSEQACLGQLRR